MLWCEMANLRHVTNPGRLNCGLGRPFTKADTCERLLRDLDATPLFSELDRRAMMSGNAERLFPRRLLQRTLLA